MSRRRVLIVGFSTAALILVIDQASKAWARASIPPHQLVPVIPHWIGFLLRTNTGATFSIFSGGNAALSVISALIMAVVALVLVRGPFRDLIGVLALGAILGGGLSNLLDRLRLQAVVDFIRVRFWPSDFNLADVAIRVGALALLATIALRQVQRSRPV